MRDLNHDLKLLCQRNKDGSFATRHDREGILSLCEVLDIPLSPARLERIQHLDLPALRALRQHVKTQRAWDEAG